jgi:hypothetical protein
MAERYGALFNGLLPLSLLQYTYTYTDTSDTLVYFIPMAIIDNMRIFALLALMSQILSDVRSNIQISLRQFGDLSRIKKCWIHDSTGTCDTLC